MKQPEIDYRAVFQALPGAVALLTPELYFADVNEEWLRVINRSRGDVIGVNLWRWSRCRNGSGRHCRALARSGARRCCG
ncbi:hypothetical protein ACWC5G_01730, partial [Streptomyces sp. NPDC001274]